MKKYQKLIVSLLIPLLIGFAGSLITSSSLDTWYPNLNKPAFNPPNWLFAPAWTTLFILIGLAFYLVWKDNFGGSYKLPVFIYFSQLILNFLWSMLFFGLKNPLAAFIEIIILWFFILINIIIFYKISKVAGILLIPYICWVSFASVLNYYIFILN